MFDFYELLCRLLVMHGFTPCVQVSRMTLHRWRTSGSVPAPSFYAVYFQARLQLSDHVPWHDFDNWAELFLSASELDQLAHLFECQVVVE